MSELDDLIASQARDMLYSHTVFPENHVSFYLDQKVSVGRDTEVRVLDFVAENTLRVPVSRLWSGCPVHGRASMYERSNGAYQCKGCQDDRNYARRRAEGRKERRLCPHPPEGRRRRLNGQTWCPSCSREWHRRDRERHRDQGSQ